MLLAFMQAHGDRIVIIMDSWPGKIVEFTAACPRLINQFNRSNFRSITRTNSLEFLRAMATRIKYTVPDEIETMLRPWLEQRMNHAISRGAFWRSAWEVRSLLIRTAGKQAARTGTKNHFDHPQASRAHMRELDIEFEMAPLELADFQAVMADIGET